jgi:hypothetical protein
MERYGDFTQGGRVSRLMIGAMPASPEEPDSVTIAIGAFKMVGGVM